MKGPISLYKSIKQGYVDHVNDYLNKENNRIKNEAFKRGLKESDISYALNKPVKDVKEARAFIKKRKNVEKDIFSWYWRYPLILPRAIAVNGLQDMAIKAALVGFALTFGYSAKQVADYNKKYDSAISRITGDRFLTEDQKKDLTKNLNTDLLDKIYSETIELLKGFDFLEDKISENDKFGALETKIQSDQETNLKVFKDREKTFLEREQKERERFELEKQKLEEDRLKLEEENKRLKEDLENKKVTKTTSSKPKNTKPVKKQITQEVKIGPRVLKCNNYESCMRENYKTAPQGVNREKIIKEGARYIENRFKRQVHYDR